MDEGGGDDLDDGQDTDLEHHLLHQIVVLPQSVGAIVQGLVEIEPGHQPRRQEEHEGHVLHAPSPAAHELVEDNVIHRHSHHRLGQGPQRPHGGAGVALPEVVLRQLPDQMPALVQLHRNGGELLVPLGKDQAGDEDHPAGEGLFQKLLLRVCAGAGILVDEDGQRHQKPRQGEQEYPAFFTDFHASASYTPPGRPSSCPSRS